MAAQMNIRLFIVGNVRLHREGLALQLAEISHLRIAGVGTLSDAIEEMRDTQLDLVLLDSYPPGSELMTEAVQALRMAQRRLRIVILGVREVESEVLACAVAGIDGYVRIDAETADLVASIESAMRDELVCSPKVAASLYHSIANLAVADPDNVPGNGLTSRELEVVELMNRGLSNKEISSQLRIETCTAKNHVQNILQKLGVHRRGQAVAKLRGAIGRRFG